ncbi:MAG: lycopene cyclase family protein [Saprospiraceae bacterium]
MKRYDYIITGGGAAGRSLICRLLASSLGNKHILLVDQEPKNANDRTWCFWETSPGFFEDIIFHSWQQLWVHTDNFSRLLDIYPYTYKLIRGIDFYRYTDELINRSANVDRLYGTVETIRPVSSGVEVSVDGQWLEADWCFNSIFFGTIDKEAVHYLDQHFRGWFVRSETDVFDPGQATLMDFRTRQWDDTRFLYVLPHSSREALIEVAIFSNQHLPPEAYDQIIEQYCQEYFPQLGRYTIEQKEMGNIPMTDFDFTRREGRLIHIGMAGGDTRASSGYTFYNIQRRTATIVEQLEAGKEPDGRICRPERRANFYDSIMLRVLEKRYYPGSKLFEKLFVGNDPARVLAFLNAETRLIPELKLIDSLPKIPFLRAFWEINNLHRIVSLNVRKT